MFSTGWLAGFVNAIGPQAVEARAFVDFVEMGQRLAFVQHARTVAAGDRRPFGVVQHSLDEITRGQKILKPLLILNADCRAAEVVGDAQRSDVHLALQVDLIVGQMLVGIAAGDEFQAVMLEPAADRAGFVVAGLHRLIIEGRLTEPFLVHAGGIHQMVGHDGVEHSHATFVEHAHDGLLLLHAVPRLTARRCLGIFTSASRRDVLGRMPQFSFFEPASQRFCKRKIGKINAPQGRILLAGFGERTV